MTISRHTIRRLGSWLACALAALAIGVPLAQASSSQQIITEHSASQNRVDLINGYGPSRSTPKPISENSASQNRLDRLNARLSAGAAQISSTSGFDWTALAIGAGSTLGLIVLASAGILGVGRARKHLVPAR